MALGKEPLSILLPEASFWAHVTALVTPCGRNRLHFHKNCEGKTDTLGLKKYTSAPYWQNRK